MGRPRLADIDTATTERILLAAEEAFAAAGFAGARLEDIAAAAGVRRPSLLYHFPSKEKLYDATVARVFASLRDSLTSAMSSEGTFSQRVDATVRNYTTFIAEHENLSSIFLREILDAGGPGSALIQEQVAPLLDLVVGFVNDAGKGVLRENLDIRGAILQIVGGAVLYAVAGPLRPALWNEPAVRRVSTESERRRASRYAESTQNLVRAMVFDNPLTAAREANAGRKQKSQRTKGKKKR